MEQDIDRLLRKEYTKQEVMAAVMYSVIQNYMRKVVGTRPVNKEKIFFQGATARNAGLVAAFENYLGRKIIVNPSCHVMGSLGSALIAKKAIEKTKTKSEFRSFDIFDKNFRLTSDNCELCSNVCRITYANIEGMDKRPSWGYMCGREPEETKARYRENNDLFTYRNKLLLSGIAGASETKHKGRTIGIPLALSTYTYLPLWKVFLRQLGYNVKISPRTNDNILKSSINSSSADFCLPTKLIYGHVKYIDELKDVEYIFLPHIITGEKNKFTTNSCFCPYVQAAPSLLSNRTSKPIIAPVIDFRNGEQDVLKELTKVFSENGFKPYFIRRAFKKGMEAQKEFIVKCQERGREIINELNKSGEPGMVIIGRPYNVFDSRVNLNIPQKIASMGFNVIPLDFLPFQQQNLGNEFSNMFWNYGQVIINAVKITSEHKNLFPVYLSNFSCGPDSFLLTYAEEIAGDKPILILEIDEHGADAGYGTRIEAFIDSLKSYTHKNTKFTIHIPELNRNELKQRKILVPPMHPIGSRLVAAAMRGAGFEAVALPDDNQKCLNIGKSLTRGGECIPAALTIGNIVNTVKENKSGRNFAIFMPTSSGPCRFGQYATLHRIILNRLGYKDIPILSPSAENAYYGLDMDLRKEIWKAILSGDILLKMACKTRPYEKEKGRVNKELEKCIKMLEASFENQLDYKIFLEKSMNRFMTIEKVFVSKPLVGIVGEIFVRCNPFSNGFVIDSIEEYGGEAWLSPVSEWIQYTSFLHKKTSLKLKNWSEIFKSYFKNRFITKEESKAYGVVHPMLFNRLEPEMEYIMEEGKKYLPEQFTAEAILTLGRAVHFIKEGVLLIVNVSPFTCMPGNISAAFFQNIQEEYGISILNLFYDGERM